jgi:hypothetical protein
MPMSREEAEFLLNKHNPHVVICPRPDSHTPELSRPFESDLGLPRGDYHPHRVELFLKYLERYDAVRPFDVTNIMRPETWPWPRIRKWPKFPWNWFRRGLPAPIDPDSEPGTEGLRNLIATLDIGASAPWEVDHKAIESQDPDQAWRVYRGLLQSLPEEETEPVVYGRCAETADATVLQYWYFYIYNDSGNKHEGDWEMVSIVLDKDRTPQRVGFAGHTGGAQRAWKDLRGPDGNELKDRPYVYVARGSHAAYLDYMPDGHKSVSIEYRKNITGFGPVLNVSAAALSRAVFFAGVRDFTPGHPDNPIAIEKGIELNPRVIPLPERSDLIRPPGTPGWELVDATGQDLRADPEWWWMYLDCRWGSSHSRFFSSIGPEPPWKKERWGAPLAWVKGLKEPPGSRT